MLLFKYNLTIILSVGLIVDVGKTISTLTSTGIVDDTQPIDAIFEDTVGPIGVPDESAN